MTNPTEHVVKNGYKPTTDTYITHHGYRPVTEGYQPGLQTPLQKGFTPPPRRCQFDRCATGTKAP